MGKKILGLDIGSNSIGFSLLKLHEDNEQIIFEELVSNSIIFSEPSTAEERRNARSLRRLHYRKSSRNKNARKIFVNFSLTSSHFIKDPTNYLNSFDIKDKDVYRIRERAINGELLGKDEFVLAAYSILTDRGYNNMFATVDDDDSDEGAISEAVSHNKKIYKEKGYALPSMVLSEERKTKDDHQNIAIRNKGGGYSNSLDREMHKEEFRKVVLSQAENRVLFSSQAKCDEFVDEILNETREREYSLTNNPIKSYEIFDKTRGKIKVSNLPFYQRPLKSFESMVEYCSYYDEFNPKGAQKRIPQANIANIELTLRQSIDNYSAIDSKSGETKEFTKEEKDQIVDFWLNSPNADKITNKNIYKNAGFKNFIIYTKDNKGLIVLDIQAHRELLELLKVYDIDFQSKHNDFYNELLLILYYYKNIGSREGKIKGEIKKYGLDIDSGFVDKVSKLKKMDGFSSFSLKFANEVLDKMKNEQLALDKALDSLGYNDRYLSMPSYNYLPPLEPTNADIEWMKENISYFDPKHLFYQPMISPKVKRVISVLRKLINELIKRYGKIDEIRIETAKELNSRKEEEKIKKNQAEYKRKNSEAEKYLESNSIKNSNKNIERAKLFKEQECQCLYCGKNLADDEIFDESITEIEHFIPRSVIWINSQKNKILVHKKCNQNKGSQNPASYLKSIGEWENFKSRIKLTERNPKYKWLTNEELIESVMAKEHWQESYLNDTRAATRTIQKYLNHYLYPEENKFRKGEHRHIVSVSGKAINELKYIWGIHTIMPKNVKGKKDRSTNYHHTLDAFTIALCSNAAIRTLHNHFKQNENKFKTKALRDKLTARQPTSIEGINIVEYLKRLVAKYENSQFYVCPYNKRKTNTKGFKDGNLKLYITTDPKDDSKEILTEIEKVNIDASSILNKKEGISEKPRNDSEVRKEVASIQLRLSPQKQKKIIDAIQPYAESLLKLRAEIESVSKEIKNLADQKKTNKNSEEYNEKLHEQISRLGSKRKELSKKLQATCCNYSLKNGKKQIVRTLKLPKAKITKTSADSILYPNRNGRSIERLSVSNFKEALANKEPFAIKENENTLCVELYAHPKQNQVVGLKYFSSLANPHIKTKVNEKYGDMFDGVKPMMTLYKNDIIKVTNAQEGSEEHFVFNGGGHIAGTNNKISIKWINHNSLIKTDKKGKTKEIKEGAITPSMSTVVSKVKIDFFGNITEVKADEK